MNDGRRQLLHETFKLVDLVIMVVAFVAATWVTSSLGWLRAMSTEELLAWVTLEHVAAVMGILIAWHVAFASRDLYNSSRLKSPLHEAVDVLRAGLMGCLIVFLLITGSLDHNRMAGLKTFEFFLAFFIFSVGTTVAIRLVFRSLLAQMRLRGRNLRSLLVIGTNHRAIHFAESVRTKPELGYYISGFVDEEWDGIEGFRRDGHKLVAKLKNLAEYMANHVVDEVVVALPVSSAYIHSSRIVSICQEQGITVRFISQIFDSRLAKAKLEVFDGEPMLTLTQAKETSFAHLAKRAIDRLGAAAALLLASPVMILAALAVKLSSPGPMVFTQTRVGLNKRNFKVYKFRTMVQDAEERLKEIEHLNEVEGPVFKIEKDPRLTPVGDFLRKTSIDELPQLWNVLKGDMSLVGPRPLPERDYQGFDDDAHRRRLSVKPGITCTWQVSGRNSIPFDEWMAMDLDYIDDWSLWLDLKILLLTVPVVVGPLLLGQKGEFMKGGSTSAEAATGGQGR
ncbi:MAG: sugar transferase [Acidobacteriota bacterium]